MVISGGLKVAILKNYNYCKMMVNIFKSPEMWICGAPGKYLCLHESGGNHYEEVYP